MKRIRLCLLLVLISLNVGCAGAIEPYTPVQPFLLTAVEPPVTEAKVLEPMLPDSVMPGDLLHIALIEPADRYTAQIGQKRYGFTRYDGRYHVLIPVSYHTSAGTTLSITIEREQAGVITSDVFEVAVVEKAFEEQSLVVSSTLQATRSDENLNNDAAKVSAAKSESLIYPLWTEAFIEPVETYRVSTTYGLVRKINGTVSGRHSGIDMAAPRGTPVYAVNDGYIRLAETLYVTGETIVLDHGLLLYSGYGHLDRIDVKAGDFVKRGQQIGTVGSTGFSTGPHLHFTFTIGSTFVNPLLVFGEMLVE